MSAFQFFSMSAFDFKFPWPVKWRFHISPGSFSALILNFRMSAFQNVSICLSSFSLSVFDLLISAFFLLLSPRG